MPIKIVSFTLSLNDWKPKIWRRIWVRDDIPLPVLSTVFYQAMGWCGYHLAEFRYNDKNYGDCSEDPPDDWLDWTKFTFHDIWIPSKLYLHYTYDFGDNWEMTVIIKEDNKLVVDAPYPVCVNGKNAPPPEDVGSYPGFEHFIQVMSNKKHPDFLELSEWFGNKKFDPNHFSADEVNDWIQDPHNYEPKYRKYLEKSLQLTK